MEEAITMHESQPFGHLKHDVPMSSPTVPNLVFGHFLFVFFVPRVQLVDVVVEVLEHQVQLACDV